MPFFRYLAEIIPPADTAVEAFETVPDDEEEEAEVRILTTRQIRQNKQRNLLFQNLAKDMEMAPLAVSGNVQRACFWVRSRKSFVFGSDHSSCLFHSFALLCSQGLKKDQKYTMKVSTVLNRRMIS